MSYVVSEVDVRFQLKYPSHTHSNKKNQKEFYCYYCYYYCCYFIIVHF